MTKQYGGYVVRGHTKDAKSYEMLVVLRNGNWSCGAFFYDRKQIK